MIGEHPEGCRCAGCYSKLKQDATRENPNRRVVPLQPRKRPEREAERETPATVTEIPARGGPGEPPIEERPTSAPKFPPKIDGVFVHGPLCDCFLCEEDLEPSYARPVGGRA